MPQRTLTSTELEQLVLGACLLGGGGGGPLSGAQPLLDYLRRNRLTVTLAGLADLPADTLGAVVAGIGAPNAASQSGDFTEAPLNAFRRYAKLLDTPPGAVLPAEVGAMNSLIPAVVAAQTGLPLIDADSAGRALPTLNLAAFNLAAPPSPLLLANQPAAGQEGVSITLNAANASQTDSLVRANLSATDDTGYSLFGSVGAFSTWALTPAQLAHSSVTGSTSRAIRLGAALRRVQTEGGDAVAAVRTALDGQLTVLAQGTIRAVELSEAGGFDRLQITLAADDGRIVHVLAVNENLIAFAEGSAAPLAAAPDTLAWLTDDGHPLSNSEIRPDTALRASVHLGRRISLLGIPAAPILREPVLASGFSALLAQLGYYGTAPALPV